MKRSQICAIFLITALVVASAAWSYGYGSLLYYSEDRGADFLKVVLLFPGPPVAIGPWAGVVAKYALGFGHEGPLGHSYFPPLSMFATLLARWAFGWVSPTILYFALMAALLYSIAAVALRYTNDLYWAICALVTYPVLMIVDRGNLNAAVASICVIVALFRRKPDGIGALLFAVAVCIRPNVLIAALPLMLSNPRVILQTGVATFAISLVSLAGAHTLDPTYTLSSFVTGLDNYKTYYINTPEGGVFGSSIFGALYALGIPSFFTATLVGLSPLPPAVFLWMNKRMQYADFTFICLSVSALTTAGFRDYHLLVFIVPLVLASNRVTLVGSLLLLAPKGLWMLGYYTVQIFINPAIMLIVSFYLVAKSFEKGVVAGKA